ncbi:MAG: hypothetical protein ABT07_05815 [Microbacterium sp. SCN 70-10]|nr:MAG: hypothetical protein ABT07_05815 [Microbacterium sp. SCN 70-10]
MLRGDVAHTRADDGDGEVVAELRPPRVGAVRVGQHAGVEVGEPPGEGVIVESRRPLHPHALRPVREGVDGCRGLDVAHVLVQPHHRFDVGAPGAQVGDRADEGRRRPHAVDVGAEVAQVHADAGRRVRASDGEGRTVDERRVGDDVGRAPVVALDLGRGRCGERGHLVGSRDEDGQRRAMRGLVGQLRVLQVVDGVDEGDPQATDRVHRRRELRGRVRLAAEVHVDDVDLGGVRVEPLGQQHLRGPPLAGGGARRGRVGADVDDALVGDGPGVRVPGGHGGDSDPARGWGVDRGSSWAAAG